MLLATNTRVPFRTPPAGRNIIAVNQSWLGNLEHDMERAADAAQAVAGEADRAEAEARGSPPPSHGSRSSPA